MARHVSAFRVLAHKGRNTPGVRPETTAMLKAAASVEQSFGTPLALEALLSSYVSAVSVLGVNGYPHLLGEGVKVMTDMLDQLTRVKAALEAGGTLPPDLGVVVAYGDGEVAGHA